MTLLQEKTMLKLLLIRCSHGDQLLRFLPPTLAEEVQNFPEPRSLDCSDLLSASHWMKSIHYSWFMEWLKNQTPPIQTLFFSLLPEKEREKIRKQIPIRTTGESISPFVLPFLLNFLKRGVENEEILSEELLPPSNLNILLELSRKELLETIDLLGIYDLAADLRQIVDKELLGKIHHALSRQQLQFLHYCTKQPIRWLSPKLGLPSWDGTSKSLNHHLHQRGLNRLARACFDEDPSFTWHLLHHLDTGRAKFMKKVSKQKQDFSLIPYFKQQVLHIIQRYNP